MADAQASTTMVAFDSAVSGTPSIYTMPLSGGTPTLIAAGTDPAWAPGGTELAFVAPNQRLATVPAAGGCVTNLQVVATRPTWSPDGTRIAYVTNNGGRNGSTYVPVTTIGVLNLVTGVDQWITGPYVSDSNPSISDASYVDGIAWAPNSDRLAVTFTVDGGPTRLVIVSPETGHYTGGLLDGGQDIVGEPTSTYQSSGVTALGGTDQPSWSADEKHLAVLSYLEPGPGSQSLYQLQLFSTVTPVVQTVSEAYGFGSYYQPSQGSVSFTPDGRELAFVTNPVYGGPSPVLNLVTDLSTGAMTSVAAPDDIENIAIADVPATKTGGYRMINSAGAIYAFGSSCSFGSLTGRKLNKPIVGLAATPDNQGYWVAASDGGIFSFGDARFLGSTGNIALNRPIVGMSVTPDGGGYWLVASDGGIFSFGDARFLGSTGNIALNRPIVGMSVTPDGGGYWLVASDGGIFTFGDAPFLGSTGGIALNRPVVAITPSPTGLGYTLIGADGGVFRFGDPRYFGSAAAAVTAPDVVAVSG